MLQIRRVTREDTAAWREMRCRLWPGGSDEHQLEIDRFLAGDRREPAEALLAFDELGTPLGFAELSIRNIVDSCSSGNVGYLEGWYVVPHARGTGVGRALVSAAEEWAREQGCTEFASDVEIDNAASLAAHHALGFEETSRAVNFRKTIRGQA